MKFLLSALQVIVFALPTVADAASAKTYSTTGALARHEASVRPLPSCGNGNDFYDGGADTDTLSYSGKRSDFYITQHLDKSYTLKDKIACRADTDTVINIERFEFADGVRTVSKLKPDLVEKKPKKGELEANVYVTAGGVPMIKPPKGWAVGTILKDARPEAYVFFTNPEKTINLQVGVGVPMSEAANPLAQTERLIALYTGSATIAGKKISGSVVSKKSVSLGAAGGYRVEIKRTDLSGKFRLVSWVVATSGPDYYYSVAARVSEKEWSTYKAAIEASFKTLRIPR